MMRILHTTLPAVLAGITIFGAAQAATSAPAAKPAAVRQKLNPPPPVELRYAIKAKQKGLSLEGEAVTKWTASAGSFSTTNQVRAALLGKILDTRSEGTIDAYGLAPAAFQEKRMRRDATTTTFDRAGKTIRFNESGETAPIRGGEQDRGSVLWQLISVARAAPSKAKTGAQWTFDVAGRRDVDRWTFKAIGQEKISTGAGELNTLHIVRTPPADSKEQQLDLWLAPSMEWYPVQLRYSEDDGDYIEQTLQQVKR
ncbi:MAG TPA: DUF3108 domain-containing protein [Noviherbaspirillum sp.]|jgi:hypothetical protein|uniref:DUF3108 domain-containing protein n=1 Tax=Noviherbaspirillum sp. TaxID=1926288 RepID=UPI002F95E9E1